LEAHHEQSDELEKLAKEVTIPSPNVAAKMKKLLAK